DGVLDVDRALHERHGGRVRGRRHLDARTARPGGPRRERDTGCRSRPSGDDGMTTVVDQRYLRPTSLSDALALRAERPSATVVAGGTDVMVEVNEHRRTLDEVIDLTDVSELRDWDLDGDRIRIGATLPLTRVVDELAPHLPGLAAAARLVGSPPIRHRATLG